MAGRCRGCCRRRRSSHEVKLFSHRPFVFRFLRGFGEPIERKKICFGLAAVCRSLDCSSFSDSFSVFSSAHSLSQLKPNNQLRKQASCHCSGGSGGGGGRVSIAKCQLMVFRWFFSKKRFVFFTVVRRAKYFLVTNTVRGHT